MKGARCTAANGLSVQLQTETLMGTGSDRVAQVIAHTRGL